MELTDASELQKTILILLLKLSYIVQMGMSKNLQASLLQNIVNNGRISALPDDQWIIEVQSWYQSVLVSLQIMFADYAIGPARRDPLQNKVIIKPETFAEKTLCHMQKMRKPNGFVYV
jgi:hypothetical protein